MINPNTINDVGEAYIRNPQKKTFAKRFFFFKVLQHGNMLIFIELPTSETRCWRFSFRIGEIECVSVLVVF